MLPMSNEEAPHTLVVPHLAIDIRALAPDVREVERNLVEATLPVLTMSAQLLSASASSAELRGVNAVQHALPLCLQVLNMVACLRVFFKQLLCAVEASCGDVGAAMMLDERAGEGKVAFANQQNAIVRAEWNHGLFSVGVGIGI